jgi:hypothetical protein
MLAMARHIVEPLPHATHLVFISSTKRRICIVLFVALSCDLPAAPQAHGCSPKSAVLSVHFKYTLLSDLLVIFFWLNGWEGGRYSWVAQTEMTLKLSGLIPHPPFLPFNHF